MSDLDCNVTPKSTLLTPEKKHILVFEFSEKSSELSNLI